MADDFEWQRVDAVNHTIIDSQNTRLVPRKNAYFAHRSQRAASNQDDNTPEGSWQPCGGRGPTIDDARSSLLVRTTSVLIIGVFR